MDDFSMHIPEIGKPRVVIVGSGFGGLNLAKSLDSQKFQIVLIDKFNYHTFQPLLYQVATAGLGSDSIASPVRDIFESKKNFHFRMAEVTGVITEQNLIQTEIGLLRYDYLVMACGTTTNFFGNEEIQRKSFPMKSLPQALDLRSKILQNFEHALEVKDPVIIDSLMDIVIVGGGPTGVELAGALGELKQYILPCDYPELNFKQMDIILIEAGPSLLGGMSKEASEAAVKFLQKDFSVKVVLGRSVKTYDGTTATLDNGETIRTQTLIWAAGVMGVPVKGIPADSIARGNRLIVDQFNKVKGTDNVYAIGDISAMISDELPRGHAMVAPVAIQQAKLLAKNLESLVEGKTLKPFKYNDQGSMATIGRNKAVVDLSFWKTQGVLAWFIWMFVHLMSLVGFRNRAIVLTNWTISYFTKDRAARLIVRPLIKNKIPELEHEEVVSS